MKDNNKQNLENRMIQFADSIYELTRTLPNDTAGKYLAGQLTRSGFSSALNYGEAKGAESPADFIHKMKIALKELRETFISLKILRNSKIRHQSGKADTCISECNELISIFVKSVQTAQKNSLHGKS